MASLAVASLTKLRANSRPRNNQQLTSDYAMKLQTKVRCYERARDLPTDDQAVQVTARAGRAGTDHDREVPDTQSQQESATI
jgi:hypothetical protein